MKNTNLTDNELVNSFISGNQSALEALLTRHQNRLYTYVYLMVKNDAIAEDLYQDTLVKIINSLKAGKYTDNGKFLSWAMRIAHNMVIDHFRREKQLKTISNDEYDYSILNSKQLAEMTIEENMVKNQIIKDVRGLVDELPHEQREVIIMRHYLDLSFKEIADHTNVSINTALGRMRYALINLRRIIEERKIVLSVK